MRLKNLEKLLRVGDKIEGYTYEEIDAAEKRLNIKLPAILREAYYRFGKNGVLNGCNYLIPPKHITHWKGFLTFYMENQGVCHWFLKLDEWEKRETNIYLTDNHGYHTFVTNNLELFLIMNSIRNYPKSLFSFVLSTKDFHSKHENILREYYKLSVSNEKAFHQYYDQWFWITPEVLIYFHYGTTGNKLVIYAQDDVDFIPLVKQLKIKEWTMNYYIINPLRPMRRVLRYEDEFREKRTLEKQNHPFQKKHDRF